MQEIITVEYNRVIMLYCSLCHHSSYNRRLRAPTTDCQKAPATNSNYDMVNYHRVTHVKFTKYTYVTVHLKQIPQR